MFEVTEHLEFPVDPFGRDEVLEDIWHLFQGHSLPISRVCHRPENKQTQGERKNKQTHANKEGKKCIEKNGDSLALIDRHWRCCTNNYVLHC